MATNGATLSYLQGTQCPQPCPFSGAKAHHDQLLGVDHDLDQVMALMELAVTWGELDYSACELVTPAQWPDFVATHRWRDPDRAEWIFTLAADAARHSVRASLAGSLTDAG